MGFLERSSLTKQMASLSALVIMMTMAALTSVVTWTGNQAAENAARADLNKLARTTEKVLDGYFESVQARADRQFRILEHWMTGDITVAAHTININGVDLPVVKVGNTVINGNHDLLDQFKSLTGNEMAILAVYNGKVYRASTLLKKDGKFMDGSEIPSSDPVSKALLDGKEYSGLTVRSGKYYFSKVKPVQNTQGQVVAAVSMRISLDSELGQIRELFKNISVAHTGGILIARVDNDGATGEWVLHPTQESKPLSDLPKDSGWLNASLTALKGTASEFELPVNLLDGKSQSTLAASGRANTWNWRIVVSAPLDEFLAGNRATRNIIIAAGALAAVVSALVLFAVLRIQLKPLQHVAQALQQLGQGQLNVRVHRARGDSGNEIDVIGHALNQTTEGMKQLIMGVGNAVEEITRASDHLLEQAHIAKECSDQQFDASSSMSASVEEMHATVSHVADNASEAANASGHVIDETSKGRQMVGGTIQDMGSISGKVEESANVIQSLGASSQQILGIVNVIREIADKTNLLALNAAIEAARAGDSGRGFAVVADEVRKLAEQTSQSTGEISSTVANIVQQTELAVEKMMAVRHGVSEGVERAQLAGSALDEIDALIEHSAVRAKDIALSTQEQKIATERFSEAVIRITELAQRNNSASEQSQRAAQEMIELSDRLKGALSRFKTA